MKHKPVIALLCDFPAWYVDKTMPRLSWYYAVWLVAMFESFKSQTQYEIHWITFENSIRVPRTVEKDGQVFHILPNFSLGWAQRFGYRMSKWAVCRVLKRIQPDLVHAWGTEGYYGISASEWKGKKLLSMQGILSVCCRKAKMSAFSERQALLEADTIRAYDCVTVESQWGIDRVHELVRDANTRLWEFAVEEPFFAAQRELSPEPLFVIAGSDRPLKNMDAALRAFSAPELAHVKLVLAGGVAEKHAIIPPNAFFPGGLRRSEMLQLLRSAWGVIHPSFADTSPNIVKEARVLGLPVVVSSDCGGAQYVEEGKSGYIVSPHDIEGMTRAVAAIVRSRETAEQMGEYGRAECRRLLSAETMIARLLQIYDEMLR